METHWPKQNVFLTYGGPTPGVAIYDIDAGQVQTIYSFPTGHSVYALAISSDGRRLVAGTKTGHLYHAKYSDGEKEDTELIRQRFLQGYGVLSVCFLDSDNIAVSDVKGRCMLWSLSGEPQLHELLVASDKACALFRLDTAHLAAITLKEQLLIWDWPSKRLVKKLPVPVLARIAAMVKPIYWSTAKLWVWPGTDGSSVFFRCT